ncbi:MAG TPA: hypothetical protein VJQ56_06855 [Blastocatellia bacterium]|nr:hypothetical protein [Blastocatellia bacterium]
MIKTRSFVLLAVVVMTVSAPAALTQAAQKKLTVTLVRWPYT